MEDNEGQSYSAFISYASPDKEKADEICLSLENSGFSCWIAPRQVRAGREYGEEIIHGIESSRCLVLILSEASNDSAFVRREVERAVSKRKPIFPVRVEEVMPSSGLELFISTTHWIDAWSGPLAVHAERLARDLGDDAVFADASQRSARIVRRRPLPRWVVTATAILVIAGVVALVNVMTGGGVDRGTGGQGASNPAGPTAAEIFEREIVATGVDPASITAEDISVSAKPEVGGAIGIRIDHSEPMRKLEIHADELYLAVGDGEFKQVGSGSSNNINHRSIDQVALGREKSIRLRYDLRDGRSIGPFTYPFDPANLLAESRKNEIISRESWFNADEGAISISFSPLIGFFDIIKAIRIGGEQDQLERRIDVIDKRGRAPSDPHVVFAEQANYYRAVPVAPDITELFVELEFADGTRSGVRQFGLPSRKLESIRLAPENAPEVDASPTVYAVLAEDVNNESKDTFAILPFAPRGTNRILRSFDHGSLSAFNPPYEETHGDFSSEAVPAGSTVQFLFQMDDGSELGPFSYKLDGIFEMPLARYEKKVMGLRRELVAAIRVLDRRQIEPRAASAGGGGGNELGDLSSTIQRRTLGSLLSTDNGKKEMLLSSLPGVILFPCNDVRRGAPYRYWAAVEEIRYGIEKEKLDQSAPVNLTPKEVMLNTSPVRSFVWAATLPVSTKEIYCQFVFRDGDRCEPFIVPIEDL